MDNILLAGIVGIFGAMLYFYFENAEKTKEDRIVKLKSELKYWIYERSKSLLLLERKETSTKKEITFAEMHIIDCNEEINRIILELQELQCSKK